MLESALQTLHRHAQDYHEQFSVNRSGARALPDPPEPRNREGAAETRRAMVLGTFGPEETRFMGLGWSLYKTKFLDFLRQSTSRNV